MSWATRYKASITNQNQGGGNKKEGLPPSVGTGSLSVWNGMGRAYGTPKDRALQVCINQLGSVNPRVYQSRYCGRIKGGGGELRDCDPRFTIDINQWTDDSTTTNSQYDVCFIMDRSGSMGTQSGNPTSWSLVRDFVDSFHDALLQRQKITPANKLPGDSNMAPAYTDAGDALASNYNAPNVAPKHRISFVSFGTNSNYNITYNTYASQIFQPDESEGTDSAGEPRFNRTSDRFDAILAAITTGGSTNAHLGVNQALALHKNQDPNIGPGSDPIHQDPALCGNMPQRLSANGPGALANDIISSINSNNPQNFAPDNTTYPLAVYPNNFDSSGQLVNTRLPPWSDSNNGYRNGWRAGNTIMIILTDGAIGNFNSYIASINALDAWETGTGVNSFSGSTSTGSTLTRIAIGLNGSNQSQIERFSRGNPGGSLNLSQDDNNHLTFPNVPPQLGLPTILNQILDSVINISFTNTNNVEYMELSLNRLLGSCLYNDVNFLEEVIPAILELQVGNPAIKLSSIDLTGQTLLSYATLQNLIDLIPNFKDNIRSINLTGCVGMAGELIKDGTTDGPLLEILKNLNPNPNPNSGLVNLELIGCTGLSSNDIKTLLEDGVNKTNNSNCTLKYLAITGINISSDLLAIFTQLGKNDTLEMLCAAKCEIDNTLFAQALPNLIYSNAPNSSISTLKHIVLDENKITGVGLKAFVDAGVGANTLIGDLKRIFVQFQQTLVTGGTQSPPAGCTNVPGTSLQPNDWLPFLTYNGNNVIQGQYSDTEIASINIGGNANSPFVTGTGAGVTPIFAVNGKIQNNYQAFVYIAGGYFNYLSFQQLTTLPADWDDPGVFYINNSSCIPGKVIY